MEDDYELCIRAEEAQNIPPEGYFGITAGTGGLSDDHDVLSFVTHSLSAFEDRKEDVSCPERGVCIT